MFSLLKSSVSVAALAIIFTAPAYSADVFGRSSTKDAPVAESRATSWTGLWIAALGGYQFSNAEVTSDFTISEVEGDPLAGMGSWTDGLGSEGLFGEVQIGFDKQLDRYVVGGFGGLNLNDAEHTSGVSGFIGEESGSATLLSFEQEWGGVLGVRAGVLKSPDTLFYAAGGWAFGELGDLKSDGKAIFDKQETDLSGWFAELGMETRVHENIYLTVAGRYTDFGSLDLASVSECGEVCVDASKELDLDTLAFMVGLKAKLGGFLD